MSEICTTCLSHDRELRPLGSMQFIYDLLMDNDGYDIPSMKICWECHAYLQQAAKLRRRALEAKDFLLKLNFNINLNSNPGVTRSMPPLSSLSTLEKFNLTDFIENDPLSIVKEEIIEDENGIDTESMQTDETINTKPTILNYKLPVAKETVIKKTTPLILQKVAAKTTDKTTTKKYNTKMKKAKEIKSESNFVKRGVIKVSKVQYEMELKRLLSEEADSRHGVAKHNTLFQDNFREAKDKNDILSDADIHEYFTRLANDPLVQVEVLDSRQVLKQRNILRSHELYRDSKFKCKHCIVGFIDQEGLDEHMKTKHLLKPGPETLRCDVCMCHIHRGMYQCHVAQHHVLYRCAECEFTMYNGNMDSHVLTHRVKKDDELANTSIFLPVKKGPQTQCTVCNRTVSVRNISKHMTVHNKTYNAVTKGSKERKTHNEIAEKDPLEFSD